MLVTTFDSDKRLKLPSHQLLSIETAKQPELARFFASEPLTKIYVHQILREKANAYFNGGDYKRALPLYNSVV